MQTMFVITGLPCSDHQSDPGIGPANNAAVQAIHTAIAMAPKLRAANIYLGSRLKGYIRGRIPAIPHPAMDFLISAYRNLRPQEEYLIKPVYHQDEDPLDRHIVPHPAVLQHSWNTTDQLLKLALNRARNNSLNPGIFPKALLTHDGLLLRESPMYSEKKELPGHNPYALDHPHTPVRQLREIAISSPSSYSIKSQQDLPSHQSRYMTNYIHTLASYPGRMAIQLSWD